MTILLDADEFLILTACVQCNSRPSPMDLATAFDLTVFDVWSILGDLYRAGIIDSAGRPVSGAKVVWLP